MSGIRKYLLKDAMYGLRDVFMYAGTKDVSLKEQITYTVLSLN